jgi:hypothetical protein
LRELGQRQSEQREDTQYDRKYRDYHRDDRALNKKG